VSEGTASKERRPSFQAVRGTRDLLPPETELWNRVEQTARDVFTRYGFGEIRLPLIEPTDLFARAIGQDTDVVSKEMFSFFDPLDELDLAAQGFDAFVQQFGSEEIASALRSEQAFDQRRRGFRDALLEVRKSKPGEYRPPDPNVGFGKLYGRLLEVKAKLEPPRGGQLLSLRPEATASVCRAYIEHGMQSLPQPVKLYYMGPMFRRERPQKGRFRQFYQIGAEILGGSDSPTIDADVIQMVVAFFAAVGLRGTTLYLNSIGHNSDDCRRRYVGILRTELEKVRDKLGSDSRRRIKTNPLRILDSKAKDEQEVINSLPKITDYICDECKRHYDTVQRDLRQRGVEFDENWRLVRGLDYYMRTTFEITAQGLGSQDAICGGGRYDGLVELLGGPPAKGIGFAIGEDRLVLSLQSQGVEPKQSADVLIAWQDEQSYSQARSLAALLREVGLSVMMPTKVMRPGEGVGMAARLGIPIGIVIGPSEVSAGVFSIKILSEGTQAAVQQNRATEIGRLLLFRVLLEKNLAKVASNHGIDTSRRPVLSLLSDLTARGVVGPDLATLIKSSFETFNHAAHGETLTDKEQTTAISEALFVLYRMSVLQWMAV
jgi:histidyl-tRNA synthetase